MATTHDDPPEAPRIERKLRFGRLQAVGLLVMLAIPTLALAGVFGASSATVRADAAGLSVEATYPERFRYKEIDRVLLRVRNTGSEPIDTVEVAFDPAYVLRFSTPRLTPAPTRPFRVPLTDLEPGAERIVLLEIQAERYGRHAGDVLVTSSRGDSVSLRLSTLVFP